MIRDLLQQYRDESAFNRDLGDRFERLMRAYLKLDPQYLALFEDVWLWKDWPQREALGYKLPDTGIDLVAKLRDEDGYCAIQCKFYDSPIPLGDLGNFFTLSGKGGFTQRLIVATAPLSKHAADALEGQTIPVELMTLEDLEASPIDWSQFSLDKPDQLRKLPKKAPRPHQSEALANVTKGFHARDRGKLIMACGTGKTYTSLIIAEQMVKPGQNILFLVPSIALLSQTLRAWTADASVPLRCFAVCSDSKASRNEEDMRIYELAYPATTNANKLAASLSATQDESAITVIFSTYQSIEVVHQAQQKTGMVFDLVVCDEAHRTAGYTAPGDDPSAFVRVHDNAYLKGKKRLYMTATPRIYAEASKSKAEENDVQVFSMDDVATFGPVFHQLRFDEAVRRDLLSDYKVLVIAVDELHVSRVLNKRIADSGDELKLDDAVKIVGCWNGLGKRVAAEDGMDVSADPQPMRTAIAFAQSIKHSKLLTAEFERIADDLGDQIDDLPTLEAKHVDGTMNVVERNQKLSWLQDNIGKEEPLCRILTNARCLSEGVDVPALDAAIFLNPRDSVVDVVQSVGRVMRKDPAGRKKYGYVILPIGIRKDASPETALDDNKKYRVVWQVLNALRAHDDRLDKQFATIDLTGKGNGVVNVIGVGGGSDKTDAFGGEQLGFAFDPEELGKWQDAMFAKIVTKCGNRRYWEDWAKDIAEIADRHQMRIHALLEKPYSKGKKAFDEFLKGVRKNLNPSVSQNDAIEMLAQHIITKPVFDALFEGYAFTSKNPVSQSMQKIMDILDAQALDKEHETLGGFYASVRERASGITDPKGRQKIIVELYDKFFKTAFPRMVERLGIVYTPVEIVDFILHSADAALQAHFGTRLADQNVHILDPFTGTGTFPVRLIETGLIPPEKLPYKYRHELHANEIVLLAYYIAAINIEEAFHRVTGQGYEPFPGIVLTDTFQMNEPQTGDLDEGLPENHKRADQQKARDIRVIVGNPPYSVGQDNANDNNQNLKYSKLDGRIAATYATHSTATLVRNLYDSYIRAFRWASDRIKDEGIVCFVTNGGWIDGNTMDGFRKTLQDEFADVYVFNLRGNARTQGEQRRKEAGNVFDAGSRTPVAITLLIKRKDHQGKAAIHYHDIGDYLSREQKLEIVSSFGSYQQVHWQTLEPNEYHDWINQRSGNFESFIPLSDADTAIFGSRSLGVSTNRDAWVYGFGKEYTTNNMRRSIEFYNSQVERQRLETHRQKLSDKAIAELIDANPRKIKWTRGLRQSFSRGRKSEFEDNNIGYALYRPYCKQWLYLDLMWSEYRPSKLYPHISYANLAIQVTGAGESKDFSCLVSNVIPNLHTISGGQCFPLYWYEKAKDADPQGGLGFGGDDASLPDANGYIKRDGITDVALVNFREHYSDESITKEDIFYYVYGVLHSPEYREQYAADLKKVLPRIPYAPDFKAFSQAGRKLADLHLNYETVEPWPVQEDAKPKGDLSDLAYYRVEKMRFASLGGRNKDKSVIVFNSRITLRGIPLEAYDYVVNGKSAIEWVMERYQVATDKDSGIKDDPNDWCREHNDPAYILNLIKRVIRVSMETHQIVCVLPPMA
ncbi:type ISP restriction/modification enzyme [Sinimarinibacterium sp. NLF-5-8]|uniref:DEAD/DEAH box helicase n=1 Tax=Sinimarinibacterium sp. NLF-5-8 TaxID=2698684 RepID=UPI00137C0B6E|nr:type ISP restriction/modification enzyme [Sinimarinibacterium sp. NLF-5-8]QHS09124.1 DEAD/DEAH box helicase [Sinimarinibacterium sp. NLF-5-8]